MTKLRIRFDDLLIITDIVLAVLMYETHNNSYIILLITLVAFFISKKGKLKGKIILNPVIFFSFLFVLWGGLSSKWAENSEYALIASLSTAFLVVWFVLIFAIYENCSDRFYMVYIVAVDIVAVYTIIYYGIDSLIKSVATISRIENAFNNVNVLGMLFAISLLISYSGFLYGKSGKQVWIQILFMLFMVLSMSSRKAMILVLIGCVLLTYLKIRDEKIDQILIKIILIISVIGIALYLLRNTVIMQSVFERLSGVLGIFEFTGMQMDDSTWLRVRYIRIGMDVFYEHKFIGIGLDNSRFVLEQLTSHATYTHNNFVELLCDTGIIGFGIYYLRHIILIFVIWKNRNKWTDKDKFAFVMELLLLLMDYGMVSYGAMVTWLFTFPVFESYYRLGNYKKQVSSKQQFNGESQNYEKNTRKSISIYNGSRL